jgi:hypothetical protein
MTLWHKLYEWSEGSKVNNATKVLMGRLFFQNYFDKQVKK